MPHGSLTPTRFTLEDALWGMPERLSVVAPKHLWESLRLSLESIFEVELICLPAPSARAVDPYQMAETAKASGRQTDGLLLVAPKRRSPANLIPSCIVNGLPIGIVQADSVADLRLWLNAMSTNRVDTERARWVVMAMWKDLYLSWGNRFIEWICQGAKGRGKEVEACAWFSDVVSRNELCEMLATGPSFAIYIGHGRSRGWSGYRGVRWEHVVSFELKKPCGVMLSLACDTLKWAKNISPFGCRWVDEGRSCAFVGSTVRLGYVPNADFALELGRVVSTGKDRTIGQLLADVWRRLESDPDRTLGRRAFRTYRIMGNPLQTLC
jgi:hypothetical protein